MTPAARLPQSRGDRMASIVAYENRAASRPLRMGMGALEDPEALGRVLAASGFFADTRDAAQAVVKVLAGQELGFGPIASMTGVYIVKGRVTLSANLIAAAIKRYRAYDFRVRTLTNDAADVVFLDTAGSCTTCGGAGQLQDGQAVKVCRECMGTGLFPLGSSEFTMADARTAGLASGDNWKKFPRNMLFARAISNGAKFFTPDVFAGAPIYTPDELGAEIDPETGELVGEHFEPVPTRQAAPTPAPKPEPAAEAAPEPDDSDPLTPERAEQVVAYLHSVGTPEAMWKMALVTYNADTVADLTNGQARELMHRAKMRYGAAESKA
jgi:hypothetical protein